MESIDNSASSVLSVVFFKLNHNLIKKSCTSNYGGIIMAIDPVCKMDIIEDSAQHKAEYQGKTYYFCSAACRNAFEKNPGKYLKEKPWWKFW